MFKKVFNSLTPSEQFGLKMVMYLLSMFMVVIGLTFGFRLLSYPDDLFNVLGVVLIVFTFGFGVLMGSKVVGLFSEKESDKKE